MKTNTRANKLLLLAFFIVILPRLAQAQLISGECFMKGDFVEIGVAPNGAYGTNNDAPAGYHGRIPGVGLTGAALGFVADPDKDGWGVSVPGRPPYVGDYYLPGYPQEGWSIGFTGTSGGKSDAWRGAGPTSFTGGLTGANVSCVTTGTTTTQVWQGTKGDLSITQTTILKKDKLYFVAYVELVNTGTTTLTNLYYNRTLDPDNEAVTPGATLSGYSTDNTIVYQPSSISKNCLVKAVGTNWGTYLGLGTKDCRAKSYICIGGLTPLAPLDEIYNHNGAASFYIVNTGSSSLNNDVGMGVVYNLGSLAPGQKTNLAYAYILKESDLDSALGETAPKFESAGAPYAPYATFRVCPGKTVPLKVINGGQYKWIWTPGTYLSAPGSSTLIPTGGTIPSVTGTKVYPTGAVYGDSAIVTVWGPKTYTATGISNCDTQVLIFYVDTISFDVPPAVTSPIRYCEGETPATLTAGAAAGASLNWYDASTGGLPLGSAPTPTTVFPVGASGNFDTTSYWVSQTNLAGCETPRARIDVIVTQKPLAPIVEDLVYCFGTPTKALTALGVNLKWYDKATGGTKYPSIPTPKNTPAGTTAYFVSQTINGCESDRAQLNVEVSQVIADFANSSDSLCGTAALTLLNNSSSTSSGIFASNWSLGDGTYSTDKDLSHQYQDARATYSIELRVENEHGCRDSLRKIIEVYKEPQMQIIASDTELCQGAAIDFEAIVTEGYKALYWDFGDGDPSAENLLVRHAFTNAGHFKVQLKGVYPACPEAEAGININVIAIPKVNLGNDTSFCPESQGLVLHNYASGVTGKYVWNTGDTALSILVSTAGRYALRVENGVCSASDSIDVSKGCYLDIPNAFTPGSGSDYDNYFLPRELLSKAVVSFEMKIFDRWGQQIFESDKISGRGWDGSYKGQAMPMGVYVYLIKVSFANGVTENYNGNVSLLR